METNYDKDINSVNQSITNLNLNDGPMSSQNRISTVEALFINVPALKTIRNNIPEYHESVKVVQRYLNLKDYMKIFNDSKLRNVYILRYSPHRALCYIKLFSLNESLCSLFTNKGGPLQILCLGAGAGPEMVAMDLVYRLLENRKGAAIRKPILHIHDKYDYEPFLKDLSKQINTKGNITWNFMKGDIIGIGPYETGDAGDGLGGEMWDLILGVKGKIELITACFVANELFAINVKQAERFFERLTQAMSPNTLLLILDLKSTDELSVHDNINLWTYLENLERTISGDNFMDKIRLIDHVRGDKFDANKYLDYKYYHTICYYDYFLYKKERVFKYQ